jgi:hypothetical protein
MGRRESRSSSLILPRPELVQFPFRFFVVVAALGGLSACQPEIGDACSNASDCSVQEQRTCDTTYPGGYCTVLGCDADTCPEEAACVAFQSVLSVAPECASLQARPRLQRTVCMKTCSGNGDCRGAYQCVDMSRRNPWGAAVVDPGASGKVCALPPPPEPAGESAVCSAPSASVPLPLPLPVADAGGDAASP